MDEQIPFRTVIKYSIIGICLLFVLAYVLFQSRYLISGPQIALTGDYPFRQNERQVTITGDTYNISRLWINDRPIYTDAQGNFKEVIVLENGYTVTTLRAEDRYGRETTATESFVFTPASFIN
jgi:hypothetical protein